MRSFILKTFKIIFENCQFCRKSGNDANSRGREWSCSLRHYDPMCTKIDMWFTPNIMRSFIFTGDRFFDFKNGYQIYIDRKLQHRKGLVMYQLSYALRHSELPISWSYKKILSKYLNGKERIARGINQILQNVASNYRNHSSIHGLCCLVKEYLINEYFVSYFVVNYFLPSSFLTA